RARVRIMAPMLETAQSDTDLEWMLRETALSFEHPGLLRQVVADLDLRRLATPLGDPALSEQQSISILKGMVGVPRLPRTAIFEISGYADNGAYASAIAKKVAEDYCGGGWGRDDAQVVAFAISPLRSSRPNVPLNLTLGLSIGLANGAITLLLFLLAGFLRA